MNLNSFKSFPPWTVDGTADITNQGNDEHVYEIRDAAGNTVGYVHSDVDCHLMAAAPDLLDVCRKALAAARTVAQHDEIGALDALNLIRPLLAEAIAKAEGA